MRNILVSILASILFIICVPHKGNAQDIEDNEKTEIVDSSKVKNTVLPFLFFLPETGLAFGITGITTFRLPGESYSRPSQVIYSAAYTLRNQFLSWIPYEIYKDNAKVRYKGELGFYRYFYNFYGIGNNTLVEDLENYDVTFPRVDFSYSRSDIDNLFFGGGFKYDNFNITRIDSAGILFREEPIGFDGGTKFNLLLNAFYDNRDNIFSTSKGIYAELRYERSLPFLFSDFDYWKYSLDVRYFVSLKEDLVLANQLFVSSADRNAPFFDLPYVSTPNYARGFSDRRFINYNIFNLQSELRFTMVKRFKGAVFVSSSLVPDSFDEISDVNLRYSYGLGVRYELDKKEKTRFRLDVAYGDTINIYLTANEAF